ncbi:MAG: hypothetical protein C0504_04125 [Candidatus Solibacter sp.]|nr:hypothetical protein [Candidatus Solibacter sp.]
MKGPRSRNEDGELRQKRGDTRVGTIEEQYGVNFGVRSDMKLDTLRERLGATSIDDLISSTRPVHRRPGPSPASANMSN